MIRVITSKKYNETLEYKQRFLEMEAAFESLKKKCKEKKVVECSATSCMDNENGKCVLGKLSINYDGTCSDFDTGSVAKEIDKNEVTILQLSTCKANK